MKYYHIIYNSSERPMDGGVGFGVRTATEGTPAGLLKAIKGISFFTDDWETYEDKPTPAQIKENPASIENVSKNYAVTYIADEQGTIYYIIARRAYVGFDYGFYKNGMPTRPGNYVIDYYAFENAPGTKAYEILYEKAQKGSNHFIPSSVCPTEDNEEMRNISVGAPEPLPSEDRPFDAQKEDKLDKDVVKLFFAYLQSKKKNQKLVVKAGREKSLKIVADFYRMLNPETAKDVRVYINLRSQGTNDNFDIFFIHDDYPHPIYDGLYDYIELETAAMPDSDEAKTFGKDLEGYVTSCFASNKADVDDVLKWLMLPEYDMVKKMSKPTNDAFFLYCIQPGNFMYDTMKQENGALNAELLGVLCPYVNRNPQNAERFNLLVAEYMNEATPDNVSARICEYNTLIKSGFKLEAITEEVKGNICRQMLSSDKGFRKILDTIGYDNVLKFFVRSIFNEHVDYVDTNVLDPYMLRLYKLFFNDEQLSKQTNIIYRFIKRGIDESTLYSIIDDVLNNDSDVSIKVLSSIQKQAPLPVDTIWRYMQHYLPIVSDTPDFLSDFSDRIEDSSYAPLFYYTIKGKKSLLNSIESVEKLTANLSKNAELKKLVKDGYANDGIYTEFYKQVYAKADANPREILQKIKDNVLDFLQVKDNRLENLCVYLEMAINGQPSAGVQMTSDRWNSIYKIIVDKNNGKLYTQFFAYFKELVKRRLLDPSDLVSSYNKFNPNSHCVDMLRNIVSSKDQVDVIGTIVKDYCKKDFKGALSVLHEVGFDDATIERFMMTYYKNDYCSYVRKNKIKAFFRAIKNLFAKNSKNDKNSTNALKTKEK